MTGWLEHAWQEFVDELGRGEVDAFIDMDNTLTDKLLQSGEGVVAEYHLFVASGGTIVMPYPRVNKKGRVTWT